MDSSKDSPDDKADVMRHYCSFRRSRIWDAGIRHTIVPKKFMVTFIKREGMISMMYQVPMNEK
jgi:hypothetical protein